VRDRDKDALLQSKGYVVHRLTRSMLLYRPRIAAERIAGSLWSFAPNVAARHLAVNPASVLGATAPLVAGAI
jgi:hypothetical protein